MRRHPTMLAVAVATLTAAILVTAAAILVTPAPSRAAALGGGTVVSTDGGTTTIAVYMDFCCAANASDQRVLSDRINALSRAAEAMWNHAFAKHPANGCVTLHLDIHEHVMKEGGYPDPNYHVIQMWVSTPGRSGINTPPGNTTPATTDWTDPYTSPLTGDYFLTTANSRTIAHETGHLMGIGDDYTDVADSVSGDITSVPLDGRKGTLMDGGDTIDQALVDRIAAQATKAGNELPTCQHWTGTVHATRNYADSQSTCHIAAEGTAALTVENGKVSGTFDTTGKATCTTKFGTVTVPDAGAWRLSGEQNADGFVISDLSQLRGSYFDEVAPSIPFTIPLAGPGRISTALMPQLPGGTLRIELSCKDC